MLDGMSSPGVALSGAAFVVALLVAAIGGFGSGSILGMLIATAGAAVAGWGFWKGTQEEKSTGAALSILLLLANLGLAGLLLILKIIHWL
jgi:hypothetical protein